MSWFEVARSVEEVLALRPVWDVLQSPFVTSDLDFMLAYMSNTAGSIRPHAVVIRDENGPVALASGRVEDVRLPARLGPKTVLNPEVRALTITYGGLMGRLDDESVPRLLAAVKESVEPGEVDVIRLRMLTVGSPAHTVARAGSPFLRREHFSTQMPHWQAEIPGSLDEFLARRSRRRRETVRRYSKRLEKTYGERGAGRDLQEPRPDRPPLRRLGARFTARPTSTCSASASPTSASSACSPELAMDRGWFRGYVLYLNDAPAAFWHGNAYHGVFGIGATGFDPAFADARPGTYLLMRVVEDLAADDSVHTLDFGFGDADYKRQLRRRTAARGRRRARGAPRQADRGQPRPDGRPRHRVGSPRVRRARRSGGQAAPAPPRAAGREGQAVTVGRALTGC